VVVLFAAAVTGVVFLFVWQCRRSPLPMNDQLTDIAGDEGLDPTIDSRTSDGLTTASTLTMTLLGSDDTPGHTIDFSTRDSFPRGDPRTIAMTSLGGGSWMGGDN
jgi:hypothetical protein